MDWFKKPARQNGASSSDREEAPNAEPDTSIDDATVVLGAGLPRPRPSTDADERVHYLIVVEGTRPGRRIQLGAEPVTLGRLPPADLVLPDQRVSRSHCSVRMVRDAVVVADLGSTNGTFVDGKRVTGFAHLPTGGRLEVGDHVLKHEWRSRSELEESEKLDRDLASASRYVQSLLPAELTEGPICTEWILLPSNRLGGDAFGYHSLDAHHFAIYLIDVCGHGAGAALHAVSVINTLRQQALPDTDFRNPAEVLNRLNAMFQMDRHGGMYATLWYGVYDLRNRTLVFCTAGHHPGYLVPPARDRAIPLSTKNIIVGAMENVQFKADTIDIPPEGRLYVFSDGVFEITTRDGVQWGVADFVPLLLEPMLPGTPEPMRLHKAVQKRNSSAVLEDDFSMLVVTFA
jgi:sigma-B regulation protein RsbU (phosphoserine phosphatase)